jgi:hypothetical protein
MKRFTTWLDGGANGAPRHPLENDFAYPGLNTILSRMIGAGLRAPYAWGILQGAHLASALGIERVSVIELGVAGGNGLVAMERIVEQVQRAYPVRVDVVGFDTGAGLPDVSDCRDAPNLASGGLYRMEEAKLRRRLRAARLVIGDIKDTVATFVASSPAPVAFLACDLVLYTSTVHGLRLLNADECFLLPRVHCYFDDVLGFTWGDYNGERLAIHEFNETHAMRKISPIYGLRHYVPARCFDAMWVEKVWLAHLFDHSMYGIRDNLVKQHDLTLAE